MIPYFKVKIGYGNEDFISITKDELEKAHYAFLKDAKVVFNQGVAHGKNIISISPDYHRMFGWNYGYKMQPEDFDEVNRKVGNVNRYIEASKRKVQDYIASGQENMIGTTTLELPEQTKKLGTGAKHISELL